MGTKQDGLVALDSSTFRGEQSTLAQMNRDVIGRFGLCFVVEHTVYYLLLGTMHIDSNQFVHPTIISHHDQVPLQILTPGRTAAHRTIPPA